MSSVINKVLESNNLTVKDVADKSHVSASTLRKSIQKPIENWSIRVLNAFAVSLDKRPGDLLNMLEPKIYTLDIDDRNQSIQGVYIADKTLYQQIRGVVEASHLEGWNPNKADIQYLLDQATDPDPELVKRIDKIWSEEND
ncbi:helix-turn-helix domain-containing protein [Lactobacillus sp. ESL0791]|uniref:helix-turn-helix domain-containing protein n=1 Tax=Lactobacillus sp. ESL0791 TaxID=2983234 RepID=UPI0023FA0E1A|nr:helix-turn-helix domain-containing protein [Lactobacillus sp. ESL0791]MDF7639770.1 helix-turn-helix domain-containing protein [Lactobacillus sp. ESL0791]